MGGSRMSFFISIHSLHTEGDSGTLHSATYREDFNPLPPHGGRQAPFRYAVPTHNISIHSLHTEGDYRSLVGTFHNTISIHSLHTEGDRHS